MKNQSIPQGDWAEVFPTCSKDSRSFNKAYRRFCQKRGLPIEDFRNTITASANEGKVKRATRKSQHESEG